MIAATVTLTATSQSLRDLIDTATPDQLGNLTFFNNRVCEIQLQAAEDATDGHVVNAFGISVLGNNSGFNIQGVTGDATMSSSRIVFRAPTTNQLSLDDVYLMGTGTVRVSAFTA